MMTNDDKLDLPHSAIYGGAYNPHRAPAGHEPPVQMKCLHGYFFRLLDRLVSGICSEEVQPDVESRSEVDGDGSSSMSCGPWDLGGDRRSIFV